MNRFLLSTLLASTALGAAAGGLDLRSSSSLRQYRLLNEQRLCRRDAIMLSERLSGLADKESFVRAARTAQAYPEAPSTVGAFVSLAPGYSAADLEEAGMAVKSVIAGIAIVELDPLKAEEAAASPAVKSLQIQRPASMKLDKARADLQLDDILLHPENVGLGRAYTGQGVIAGVIDAGFDAHHINFRYANGESRIGYLAWLRMNAAGTGIAEDHYNYANISNFTTDSPYQYHGTHTAGIMAGSYNGPIQLPKANSTKLSTEDSNLYGAAPAADMAVSCGDLYDIFIAYGLECLVNYSKWEERPWPMVVNMSIGSTSGARDKNSLINRILNEMGKEAIICVSAGNEGDLKLALNKTFTEDDKTLKSFVYPYAYRYDASDPTSVTLRSGSVEVWSEDSRPFQLKAVIYNKKRNYRSSLNMGVLGDNIGTYYVSSEDFQASSDDVVGDPSFCKAFEGYVGVGGKIDEETGRYYGMVDYYVANNPETNLEDDYVLGFEITGVDGQRIDCYCDGTTTWLDSMGVEGFADGSTDGTINDMAVADNVIAVGSYNTRDSWLALNGQELRYDRDDNYFKPGYVSGFSSYGTMADGSVLPWICAPGSAVISSVSWPYAQMLPEDYLQSTCSAQVVEDGRVNYWKQESGTSMSTPVVAGSIALWLEANPELTVADVKDIIARTAIQDDKTAIGEPARWGHGKFNALDGLKEAIRLAGVEGIGADGHNDRLLLDRRGDLLNIFLGEATSLDVSVISLDGRTLLRSAAAGDETSINLSGLPKGVHILNVNGRHSAKIII